MPRIKSDTDHRSERFNKLIFGLQDRLTFVEDQMEGIAENESKDGCMEYKQKC